MKRWKWILLLAPMAGYCAGDSPVEYKSEVAARPNVIQRHEKLDGDVAVKSEQAPNGQQKKTQKKDEQSSQNKNPPKENKKSSQEKKQVKPKDLITSFQTEQSSSLEAKINRKVREQEQLKEHADDNKLKSSQVEIVVVNPKNEVEKGGVTLLLTQEDSATAIDHHAAVDVDSPILAQEPEPLSQIPSDYESQDIENVISATHPEPEPSAPTPPKPAPAVPGTPKQEDHANTPIKPEPSSPGAPKHLSQIPSDYESQDKENVISATPPEPQPSAPTPPKPAPAVPVTPKQEGHPNTPIKPEPSSPGAPKPLSQIPSPASPGRIQDSPTTESTPKTPAPPSAKPGTTPPPTTPKSSSSKATPKTASPKGAPQSTPPKKQDPSAGKSPSQKPEPAGKSSQQKANGKYNTSMETSSSFEQKIDHVKKKSKKSHAGKRSIDE